MSFEVTTQTPTLLFHYICELTSGFQIIKRSKTWCAIQVPTASNSVGHLAAPRTQADVAPRHSSTTLPLSFPCAGPVTAVSSLSSLTIMGEGGVVEVAVEGRVCVLNVICSQWAHCPSALPTCHHQPPPLSPPQPSREKQAVQWQRHFQLFSHKELVCKTSLGAWKIPNGLSQSGSLIQEYF